MKKIDQIKEYVEKHPGCTSYEICKVLGPGFDQIIYYAAKVGKIRAVRDTRFKRSYIFHPIKGWLGQDMAESEKVPE